MQGKEPLREAAGSLSQARGAAGRRCFSQPMANAAFYYLEPQSMDGFVGWGLLDNHLRALGWSKSGGVPDFQVPQDAAGAWARPESGLDCCPLAGFRLPETEILTSRTQ